MKLHTKLTAAQLSEIHAGDRVRITRVTVNSGKRNWLVDIEMEPESDPALKLDFYGFHTMSGDVSRIAKALESLDRKTATRRPRVIVCEHQDTHPEWGES